MTRTETRCGCFLSDLTGLARSPSIANLPPHISSFTPQEAREAMKTVDFAVRRISAFFVAYAQAERTSIFHSIRL